MTKPEQSLAGTFEDKDAVNLVVDDDQQEDAIIRVVKPAQSEAVDSALTELQDRYPNALIMSVYGINILKVDE